MELKSSVKVRLSNFVTSVTMSVPLIVAPIEPIPIFPELSLYPILLMRQSAPIIVPAPVLLPSSVLYSFWQDVNIAAVIIIKYKNFVYMVNYLFF